MQDGRILDNQINSSGDFDYANCRASFGRLHRQYTSQQFDSSWCSSTNTLGVYLQVNFLKLMTITRIATQGRVFAPVYVWKQFVTSYQIQYYGTGNQWLFFKGPENSPIKVQ